MILWRTKDRLKSLGRFHFLWNSMRYLMNVVAAKETCWQPGQITGHESKVDGNYAVVVLNRRIQIPSTVVVKLWQNAKIRLTVDAGTDKWLSFVHTFPQGHTLKLPDLITGDFDSITDEALKFYTNATTRKVHTPNQNETDFTKALKVLKSHVEQDQITKIVVFHETSGRFDQIMGNINTVFKGSRFLDNVQIYLLSSNSLTWLLHPGKHSIEIPKHLVEEKSWCALIPFSGKTRVTTNGLKWDLDNGDLEFGQLVSTSNTYSSQLLNISTNKFIVWSMGVFSSDDNS